MLIIAAKHYNAILHVLNAIQTFHFADWHLMKSKKEIFDRVIVLTRERRQGNQTHTNGFPFILGYARLQSVDGED